MTASVAITHPEKVLFPDAGITKGEVAAYYEAVAPLMVPHVAGRPVTMERYPAGIEKKGFLQKNVVKGFPDWLERVEVERRDPAADDPEGVHYPTVREARALLWLANQNCITPHVWTSRVPNLFFPDLCVFDLDPLEDDADALRFAALLVRDVLAELGVTSWVKTSGSKGFHVAFALDGKSDGGQVARFAHGVGRELVRRAPDRLTQEFYKADRGGKILVDTGRNEIGATHAVVYAVRPKPHAPVSAPCTWDEVEGGGVGPTTFTLRTMSARLDAHGDLWSSLFEIRHALPTV